MSLSDSKRPQPLPQTTVVRGAFILIEGLDRAGKTTQVQLLCETLSSHGHNVETIRFPDRASPIGKMIDSYLRSSIDMDDHAIHLLFSANRWEKAKWIEETLAAGYTIVCDRYYYSGMVYSAAKQNPSLTLEWVKTPDIGLPQPDLVVFLDLEPEEAEKRGGYGDEKYEKREMQQRVRSLFVKVLHTQATEGNVCIVDAGASVNGVAEHIFREVKPVVAAVARGDFGGVARKVSA